MEDKKETLTLFQIKSRKYAKQYYKKNKKRMSEQHKEYNKIHKEEIAKYYKEYIKKKKEKMLE